MKTGLLQQGKSFDLRKKAEELLPERVINPDGLSPGDIRKLVHELQLNQIELELQNEELRSGQQKLYESEERYRCLVQDSADGIVVVEGFVIKFVNHTLLKMFGCHDKDEMLGQTFTEFIAHGYRDLMAERELARERGEHVPRRYEFKAVRNDGTEFDAELSVSSITYRGSPARQGIIRDITVRSLAESRIEQLNRLKEDLLNPGSPDEKLKCITDAVIEIFKADISRIWLTKSGDLCDSGCYHSQITEDQHACRFRDRCLHLVVSSGRYVHTDGKVHRRVPFGCYKIGRIAAGDTPKYITNDATRDPRVHDHDWAKELGLVSFAGFRLLSEKKEPIGVLALFSKQPITSNEGALLENLADTAALVIQTARVFEDLHKSEQKFSSLVENIPDIIWTADCEGKTIFISSNIEKIYGFTPSEISRGGSRLWLGRIHPDDIEQVTEAFDLLFKKKKIFDVEYRIQRKDGRWIWLHDRSIAVYEKEGLMYADGIVSDITERKRVETTFRELEKAVETMQLGVTITDLEGKIIYSNPAEAKIHGYQRQELIGRDVGVFAPPGRRKPLTLEQIKMMNGFARESVNRKKDKSLIPVYLISDVVKSTNGTPIAVVTTCKDITTRKRAEEALQKSEARFRSLIEYSPLGISISRGSLTQYVNSAYLSIFGYADSADVYGTSLGNRFAPQCREKILDRNRRREREESVSNSFDSIGQRQDGSQFPLHVDVARIELPDGLATIAFLTDITERKQMEEALREGQNRYSLATRAAKVGVWDWNLQTGKFYLDPNLKAILGYSDREIPNDLDHWASYVHPDDKEPVMKAFQAHIDEKTPEYVCEHRMRHKDGSIRWILVRGTAIRDDRGNAVRVVGTDTDITDRKIAEEALRTSEQQYRTTIDALGDAIHVIDEDYRITLANTALKEWIKDLGLETNITGRTIFEAFPFVPVAIREEYRQVFCTGKTLIAEESLRIKDAHFLTETRKIPIFKEGMVSRIVTVIRDITKRKRAEEALRESRDKFRGIIENIQDIYYRADLNGNLVMASPSGPKLFGYDSVEELIGKNIAQTFYADPRDRDKLLQELEKTGQVDNYELLFKKSDGTTFTVLTSSHFYYDQAGKPLGVEGIATDISDRKRAEEAVKHSEYNLREANAAKDKFLSIIAHDLKNPLEPLILGSEALMEGCDTFSKEEIAYFAKGINESTNHLHRLLENLLEWARSQIGSITYSPEQIDLEAVIMSILSLFQASAATKDIDLQAEIEKNSFVYADQNMIKTVVRNLISNAIKFTKPGGTVKVTAQERNDWTEVTVIDSGIGINRENIDKLFRIDINYSTKGTSNEKGTGLGLILCKELIEKNGGKIWVESESGKGSAFRFLLPEIDFYN